MSHFHTVIERINHRALDGRDWRHQVISQVDAHGSTKALKTTFLKPYFTSAGKEAWSKSDGYTVHFPSLKITYHDRRTEFLFKQSENSLENQLQKLLQGEIHDCI